MGAPTQQQQQMPQQQQEQVPIIQRNSGGTIIETPLGTVSFSDWTGILGIVVIIVVGAIMKKYIAGPYSIFGALLGKKNKKGTGDGNTKPKSK